MSKLQFDRVVVGKEFPLRGGEVLRIREGKGKETRVRILSSGENCYHCRTYQHDISTHTNKEQITLVGGERKLRRV